MPEEDTPAAPGQTPTEVVLRHSSGDNAPFTVPVPPGWTVQMVLDAWTPSGHELVGDVEPDAGLAGQDVDYPKGNASHDEWRAFALGHGKTPEELESLSRDDIRDLFITKEN